MSKKCFDLGMEFAYDNIWLKFYNKWPLATISDPEALDTFQRDISFQNQNQFSDFKSNNSDTISDPSSM